MIQPSDDQLQQFVAEAIRAGWPDNTYPRKDKEFSGFFHSNYVREAWRYFDLWSGDSTDMGFQAVFHQDVPIWACSYRGGIMEPKFLTTDSIDANPVFAFLTKAMRLPPDPTLPLRGPQVHEENSWVYTFHGSGTIASCLAIECIHEKGQKVYERLFIGGRIGSRQLYGLSVDALMQQIVGPR
jgi:hypothetical protein